ncbi:LCP family protein [Pedobacter antarcticus]|uniref:LCP family protein n=1 Tax=Pedobacter antarcticus TaxID=34086 RepID=UPI001C5849E1|nr:LCP family protein [Pedobacter antarcticus]
MKTFFLQLNLILFMVSSAIAQDTLNTVEKSVNPAVKQAAYKLNKSPQALGISQAALTRVKAMQNPPVNIALFAVDRRKEDELGNSDVIMIISLDQITKKIKMTSILRDTYVEIEGKGKDKINAAFAIGGPQLAIKTLNQNFGLDIQDYINVDFFGTAKMIDALGGVDVNLKPEEIPYLNNYLQEISIIEHIPATPVKVPGLQRLNGKQTVAYTRIRAVGRGDFERTERQRTVLVALFNKLQGAGAEVFPVFMSQILPNLETSMSNMTLFKIGGDILGSKSKTIEQARFPTDTMSKGIRVNNIWYLSADLKATTQSLHNFIYKNIPPVK